MTIEIVIITVSTSEAGSNMEFKMQNLSTDKSEGNAFRNDTQRNVYI
jgi:hypothetical protein